MLGKALVVISALLLTGTIPATLTVTATIFALAVTVTLLGGDPTRILSAVVKTAGHVQKAVEGVVGTVVDSVD